MTVKNLFEYLPLIVFLMIGFWGGTEEIARWNIAWKISSILAVIYFILNHHKLNLLNRLFLSANLFLMIGGLLAWLGLGSLLGIYGGLLRGASLFGIMCLVGILTTIFSDRGYINLENTNSQVKSYSWLLVVITIFAGVMSWVFRENQILEGTIPFVLVYVTSMLLKSKAEEEQIHSKPISNTAP